MPIEFTDVTPQFFEAYLKGQGAGRDSASTANQLRQQAFSNDLSLANNAQNREAQDLSRAISVLNSRRQGQEYADTQTERKRQFDENLLWHKQNEKDASAKQADANYNDHRAIIFDLADSDPDALAAQWDSLKGTLHPADVLVLTGKMDTWRKQRTREAAQQQSIAGLQNQIGRGNQSLTALKDPNALDADLFRGLGVTPQYNDSFFGNRYREVTANPLLGGTATLDRSQAQTDTTTRLTELQAALNALLGTTQVGNRVVPASVNDYTQRQGAFYQPILQSKQPVIDVTAVRQPVQEVIRVAPDGRRVVYNAVTKQPIRYAE